VSETRAAIVDDKRFWDIIAVGCPRSVNPDDWDLISVLKDLDLDELVRFDRWFNERTDEAYRRDLWSVAELVNGGASDDGFEYFCCWLVGMGKQVFEAVLANPDNLADVVEPDFMDAEAEIYSSGWVAWRERGGDEEEFDRADDRLGKHRRVKLRGRWLNFYSKAVRKRFPKLTALYRLDEEYDE
jgi:hypothetical protein